MAEFNFAQLGIEVGGSALIGAIIGFAAKTVAKVIAIIIGGQLVLFKILESRGIITVDWGALTGGLIKAGKKGGEATGALVTALETAGVGGAFAAGFLLGFKKA